MTHDQIREMVRRVNPIPDPSMLEIVDVPDLTTPLERRTDMQIDDRPGTEVPADRNRRRGPLVGIAAAALILVAGLVFFLTRDNTPVAEPAPNATPLTEMDFLPIDPGAYFVDTDGDPATTPRGTFVIEGSGWSAVHPGVFYAVTEDEAGLMVAEVDRVGAPACGSGAELQPAGTSAEDLANQFAAAGFSIQEAVSPVSAFGHSGYHLVVEVPPGCDGDHWAWEGPTFGRYYHQSPDQVVEYWFLDVEGTPVMVEASWMAAFAEEDVAQLRAAIDTLVITP